MLSSSISLPPVCPQALSRLVRRQLNQSSLACQDLC
ncbi:hypothetical protein SLEP1_g59678 [Rubroshorea leprosula]|uniref:Uncharacterized protein n=1 Tax=Rubroshorea leprosula TaxID=152421 RepID=A0AAV5MT25_9ROSI|nr:hypothetical protein SLEP1_g59678 [Rubroshorea leprosula]